MAAWRGGGRGPARRGGRGGRRGAGDPLRLVVASRQAPAPVERHGDYPVEAGEPVAQTFGQATAKMPSQIVQASELQSPHHGVERRPVAPEGEQPVEGGRALPAGAAPVVRRQGVAASGRAADRAGLPWQRSEGRPAALAESQRGSRSPGAAGRSRGTAPAAAHGPAGQAGALRGAARRWEVLVRITDQSWERRRSRRVASFRVGTKRDAILSGTGRPRGEPGAGIERIRREGGTLIRNHRLLGRLLLVFSLLLLPAARRRAGALQLHRGGSRRDRRLVRRQSGQQPQQLQLPAQSRRSSPSRAPMWSCAPAGSPSTRTGSSAR